MADTRVLIANRGEIAVRIIRTCRELGIPSIAVYSDADREALFVDMADEAYRIGPPTPSESYLSVEAILGAAERSGATAIHPGYGFLAENGDFARAVAASGLTFIGPPPEAMDAVGDKITARRAAERVGVPVVPGSPEPMTPDRAKAEAAKIGFPIAVKAAFGGGGRGMRVVHEEGELADALERSAREAEAYFGRPEVYLERYVERGHHVEAQILGDTHGNVSFLGERDCTLQRRFQKLVEETPSPIVDAELRARIGESALALAKEVGYTNAGTVEFLVDEDGSYYFLEVNARLQVEHPVTEMVTGTDLVALQIAAALGEKVDLEPQPRGHAIECRLNAEDPRNDFLPGPGRVSRFRPPGGPFVRLDAGIEEGRTIPGDYDSLFGKLICWGEDREAARRRTLRALGEMVVRGVPTTIPFHQWVLQQPEFIEATATTKWVEEALASNPLGAGDADQDEQRLETAPEATAGPARGSGRPVVVHAEVEGRRIPVRLWGDDLRAAPRPPASVGKGGGGGATGDLITAPMQGTILQVMVEEGQQVSAGDVICILEAMKMENHIAAHEDGTVTSLSVKAGDVVETGQTLAVVE